VKRSRIPATRCRTLLVLPSIADDYPEEIKNGLAVRNACATEGACPVCGATGELYQDRELTGVFHLLFEHEVWCSCLTDGVAA
jgi:hypothetical protein